VTPAVVEWVDAHADAHGWTSLDDLEPGHRTVKSCGWLLDAKPGHVTLAQSVDGDTVDSVLHIPAEAVRSIHRWVY
jgi:hypothetical protein